MGWKLFCCASGDSDADVDTPTVVFRENGRIDGVKYTYTDSENPIENETTGTVLARDGGTKVGKYTVIISTTYIDDRNDEVTDIQELGFRTQAAAEHCAKLWVGQRAINVEIQGPITHVSTNQQDQ